MRELERITGDTEVNIFSRPTEAAPGLFDDYFNDVLMQKNYAASYAGSVVFLLHTHSLRCGLEEYRQLRRLTATFVHSFSQ